MDRTSSGLTGFREAAADGPERPAIGLPAEKRDRREYRGGGVGCLAAMAGIPIAGTRGERTMGWLLRLYVNALFKGNPFVVGLTLIVARR